ncbi:restriction endonuclease [Haloarcula marismortui]|uniref:Restriction endonuclease n=1 Tax=Haloarcula marismortui ATCC 33799 TaxID=662475 RepID=M0KRD5_9EURY|nr:restriction endonuclease [Haloarcula californiae]EMA23801.1 restriction endonuclease [Haloarcula californiae ATCC 33799]
MGSGVGYILPALGGLLLIHGGWIDREASAIVVAISYFIAIILSPLVVVGGRGGSQFLTFLERFGKLQKARDLLQKDLELLRSDAPNDYPVEIFIPDWDEFESLDESEEAMEDAFESVEIYKAHLKAQTDLSNQQKNSKVSDLLLTAAKATHPSRCSTSAVAKDAADALAELNIVCKRFEAGGFDEDLLTPVLRVCRNLESSAKIDTNDVQRLWNACNTFEDRLSNLEECEEFNGRLDQLRSDLASNFDDPPVVDLDANSVSERDWERLKHYEQLLAPLKRAKDLSREYPGADLPVELLSLLRKDAVDTSNLESYELLVDTSKLALEVEEQYGAPFDKARSQLLTIAQGDPIGQVNDIEALQEVLHRGSRTVAFLNRVDHGHPSVEAAEWQNALAMAVEDVFPNVLRPIDQQIQEMDNGLWEHSDLFTYDWQEFESLVGSLYADKGYEIEVTTDTIDGGVDVWARSPRETVAIQVKQNSQGNMTGRRVLQQLASTIAEGSADRVVVVTSGNFADTANEYSNNFGPEMELVDGEELVRQLSMSNLPPPGAI